jgi:DNA-binding PucR family transcriptional regulator
VPDGDDRLVTALDHDLVGLAVARPSAVPGTVVGVGPPGRLAGLPVAFALAGRALQTALAFGQEGVFSLADLGIRPAVLADEALGEVLCARQLEPLASLGRFGGELEATLRAFVDHDLHVEDTARALHVHPNTLRHRLRRYEQATGASLRRQADLVELWWALERRRLGE